MNMKVVDKNRPKSYTMRIVGGMVLFGCLIWLTDAIIDNSFFYSGYGSFLDFLFRHPSPHGIYMRCLVFVLCILAGIVLAWFARRHILNQAKFQAITERTSDITVIADAKGLFTYISPSIELTTGYRPEQVIGSSAGDFVHSDDLKRVRDTITRAMEEPGKRFRVQDFGVRHHDGQWLRFDALFAGMPDIPGVEGVVINCRDITLRIQTEKALEISNTTYREIFDSVGDGIFVHDIETGDILDVNARMCEMFGYSRDEILVMDIGTLSSGIPPYTQIDAVKLARKVSNEDNQLFRWHSKHSSGNLFWMEVGLKQVVIAGRNRILAVARDITKRKIAEQALQKRLEFERLITNMSSSFVNPALDNVDGVITAALKAIGEFAEIDRSYVFLFRDDGITVDYSHEWCAAGIMPQINGLKGIRVDTDLPWFAKSIRGLETFRVPCVADIPVEGQKEKQYFQKRGLKSLLVVPMVCSGSLTGFLGFDSVKTEKNWTDESVVLLRLTGEIFANTIERVNLENARQELIEELESKNAELERFTYSVSHDLKSPLITIKGFLGVLQEDALSRNTDLLKEDIARIENAADNMGCLLEELLELSRIGHIVNPPTEFSFDGLLRDALGLVAGSILKSGVEIEFPDNPVTLRGDRPRLLEVLQNLIDNAVKFMGDQPGPRINVRAEQVGTEIVCCVKDNGVGIDSQYSSKVFGLFEQLDPKIEGTGVGLALTKRIVEVHGGSIRFESAGTNQGSSFFFTLPAAPTNPGVS